MLSLLRSRFSLLFALILNYLILSFLLRWVLYFLSIKNFDLSVPALLKIFIVGLFFDLAVALFFTAIYSLYLFVLPSKLIGTIVDKVITHVLTGIILFITIFSLFAEIPFWQEFYTRFNFIAVDYLIYTYEVIENINQTYPLYSIIILIAVFMALFLFVFKNRKVYAYTFGNKTRFKKRLLVLAPVFILTILYGIFLKNSDAETSRSIGENELSKNGTFSFFAALRSNELDYHTFYATEPNEKAYEAIKRELLQQGDVYVNNNSETIERLISGNDSITPNLVLITIESFSGSYLRAFGNTENLTENFERLADSSLFFTNMYAAGTRTARGMEALTLCVPPTPGNSIVRRPDNDNLFSIATILKRKNYALNFIYGGDGYFDNMNTFFGGQGFDIVDRDRGNPLSDNIKTNRYSIEDSEVTFENAWGVCDEDLYRQSIKYADIEFSKNKPFFQFLMTTSNHKPYSFPQGKIDMPTGTEDAAVKYTDYALGKFIEQARTKPWFVNTVFVIVADHCANSAGKWEINIDKHHIPAIIYNLPQTGKVNKLCSQIDLMPTVFGLLNWNYRTALYGKDIQKMAPDEERAVIANYRTLGLLKANIFTELNDKKQVHQYKWDANKKIMTEIKTNGIDSLKKLTIAYYQTASERFKNGNMKVKLK